MPLSGAAARKPIHQREITCRGFLREDGLWDVEAHLVDTKAYAFENRYRGTVPAGEAVHEMWLRLTLDDDLAIQAVEAATDRSPFPVCPAIAPNFQRLKGLKIGKGFIAQVRKLLGGVEGCTHLVELVGPLASAAFQTIYPYRQRQLREAGKARDPKRRPHLLNSCHAFAQDGEVVRLLWPEWARPPQAD